MSIIIPMRPDNNEDDQPSLVERTFLDPDTVSQGEYFAIYEFLLSPDIKNDPEMIAGVLEEFAGWAQYMLKQIQEAGLTNQADN